MQRLEVFTPNDDTNEKEISDFLANNLETEESIRLLTPKKIKKKLSNCQKTNWNRPSKS